MDTETDSADGAHGTPAWIGAGVVWTLRLDGGWTR
jgi:hypothetical protein